MPAYNFEKRFADAVVSGVKSSTIRLSHKAQENVLSPYVVMVEALGFFLGQGQYPSGSFRELLESAGHGSLLN